MHFEILSRERWWSNIPPNSDVFHPQTCLELLNIHTDERTLEKREVTVSASQGS